MSSRSVRRSTAQASADSARRQRDKGITLLEKLVLAQAVYEYGFEWTTISNLLSKHPLLSRPKPFFAANACQSMYKSLLDEAGVQLTNEQSGPKAPHSQTLAETFYRARIEELRELIAAEEAHFKQLFQEVEEIRSGAWDGQITADIKLKSEEHAHAVVEIDEDELDSKQVQSEIVEIDEGHSETLANNNPNGLDHSGRHSPAEGYSSGEESPIVPKTRGGNVKRGRPKAKSPAVRRSGRLSTDVEVAPEVSEEAEKEETSPAPSSGRRTGKRKASSVEAGSMPRETKRIRETSESVVDEDSAPNSSRRQRAGFQSVITLLHNQIYQHRYGSLFHSPIKESEVENYHDIIKRPVDLKTIRAKTKDGTISNSDEYLRDVYLMFANAMMFNPPNTATHHMAKAMLADSESGIHNFRQSESYGQKAK